ncbi:hypothetical protein RRSWK_05392 [Rhodopirellula sp. SWK7]|nr:hypothetical protein RRSWK_05392 [Rhodopirellula sp. SWK7]
MPEYAANSGPNIHKPANISKPSIAAAVSILSGSPDDDVKFHRHSTNQTKPFSQPSCYLTPSPYILCYLISG